MLKSPVNKRLHWTHRQARRNDGTGYLTGAFFIGGLRRLEKARNWFGVASDVCNAVKK